MERVTGIEPASRAWEALILPLNYTRSDAEHSTDAVPPGLRPMSLSVTSRERVWSCAHVLERIPNASSRWDWWGLCDCWDDISWFSSGDP